MKNAAKKVEMTMILDNPICHVMGWPVPSENEHLLISVNGRPCATLTAARNGYSEGVYLIDAGYGVPNACCAVMSWPPETLEQRVRRALARKIFANNKPPRKGELEKLVIRLATDVTVMIGVKV